MANLSITAGDNAGELDGQWDPTPGGELDKPAVRDEIQNGHPGPDERRADLGAGARDGRGRRRRVERRGGEDCAMNKS